MELTVILRGRSDLAPQVLPLERALELRFPPWVARVGGPGAG
jgi:hypothetical protein